MVVKNTKVDTKRNMFTFQRLLPNILTLGALCSGLTGLRFAIEGRFEHAVLAVVFAALLDNLDGRVARLVGANSGFGAELDSLSDFVSFGAVPAIMLYLWNLNELGRVGWVIALIYCICGGLRLARFNMQGHGSSATPSAFFRGIPIPAAAGFIMFPMMLSFAFDTDITKTPYMVVPLMLLAAGLMVSSIHSYSFKRMRILAKLVFPILLIVGIFAAMVSASHWFGLIGIVGLYAISIPFAMRAAKKADSS